MGFVYFRGILAFFLYFRFFFGQKSCTSGVLSQNRVLLGFLAKIVPNAPRRRAHADNRYYEENIMESYFHPEGDHHIGPGP